MNFHILVNVNTGLPRPEFWNEFWGFKHYEIKLSMFTEPYTFDIDKADSDKQMEETEVQCDSLLKEKFSDLSATFSYILICIAVSKFI